MPDEPCPCGLPASYGRCCGRYHAGALRGAAHEGSGVPDVSDGSDHAPAAPDAEALMRSRYSAYVRGLSGYLLRTWHPRTRPATLEPDPPGLRWLGLEVRAHRVQDADHATVEFVARSKLAGRAFRLHETSRFERVDGRWLYVDGELR